MQRIKDYHQPAKGDSTIEVMTKSLELTQLLALEAKGYHRSNYNVETKLHTTTLKVDKAQYDAIVIGTQRYTQTVDNSEIIEEYLEGTYEGKDETTFSDDEEITLKNLFAKYAAMVKTLKKRHK